MKSVVSVGSTVVGTRVVLSVVTVSWDSVVSGTLVTDSVGSVVTGGSLVSGSVVIGSVGTVALSVVIGRKVVISGDAGVTVVIGDSDSVVSGTIVTEAVVSIVAETSPED